MGRTKHAGRRYVDMWAVPGVHPTNNEYLQKFKMADSPYFTRNMDAVGTIKEQDEENGWETSHLIGLRTDIWKPDSKDLSAVLKSLKDKRQKELKREIKKTGRLSARQKAKLQQELEQDKIMQLQCDDIVHRRLVLKLFKTTGKRLNWTGSLEQLTTNELQHSIGSKKPLLSFAAILPRYEYVVHIQQNHRTFAWTNIFTLSYFHEGRMWPVCLRQRIGSIGAYYDITVDGKKIGSIDGVLFAFGSDSYVDIFDHELKQSRQFADLLTLFAASVGYHRSMRRSTKKRLAACRSGDWQSCIIEDEELTIHKNGRAA